jgi:hypothetical protein
MDRLAGARFAWDVGRSAVGRAYDRTPCALLHRARPPPLRLDFCANRREAPAGVIGLECHGRAAPDERSKNVKRCNEALKTGN